MAIELHWLSGSPYAWRVQLALLHQGLDHVSHRHQLSTGELQAPDYLALNPRGRVPTLVEDGFVLYESMAILAYLDRRHPERPLFGATPGEVGLHWRHISEYTAYLDPEVEGYILPIYFGRVAEEAATVRAHRERILAELPRWNAALDGRAWLVGDGPGAADFVLYPALKSLERASGKDAARAAGLDLPAFAEAWPHLAAFMARIEAMPGFARTWPPHWGEPPAVAPPRA